MLLRQIALCLILCMNSFYFLPLIFVLNVCYSDGLLFQSHFIMDYLSLRMQYSACWQICFGLLPKHQKHSLFKRKFVLSHLLFFYFFFPVFVLLLLFFFCFRFLFIKFSLVFVCMFVCFCIRSILCTCVLMYSASIYGVYMSRDPNMPFKFNIHTGNGSGRGVLMTTMKYHKNMTFLFYRNLHVM